MNRKDRLSVAPLVAGVAGWIGVVLAILKLEPGNVFVETVVLIGWGISEYLVLRWLTKKSKLAIALTIFTCGALLLNRLGVLDILTGILLVIITLLISFIN